MKVDVYSNRAIMSLVFQLLRHIRGLTLARCMKSATEKNKAETFFADFWFVEPQSSQIKLNIAF